MATRNDVFISAQYPVASQTANLRASQAASNAQLAAQNAAVTASSNPRVTSPVQQAALSSAPTVSGNKIPTATAAQIAALRNSYVNSQPVQTTPVAATQAQQMSGASRQASTPAAQATPTASASQAAALRNPSDTQGWTNVSGNNYTRSSSVAQTTPTVSGASSNANILPSGSLNSSYASQGIRSLGGNNFDVSALHSTPATAASTTAEAPAAETPAAEAPKATMYTPTTLAAKSASTAAQTGAAATTPAATPASTVATQTATTTAAKPAATTTPAATTAPAATAAPAATTAKSSSGSESVTQNVPVEYTPTGMYDLNNLRAYNDQRVADIRSIYDDALRANLASMQRAYDQNMSDAEAARDLISPQYQRSMNSLSAEYERQRRNNNMQAAANGLNTGAGSQMALAQSANYQANQAGLAAKENEALNEANRRIGDLKRNYQNAIAEATANNNYKLAASLMEEYQNAYNRQLQIENTNYERSRQMEQQNYTRSWNEDERSYSRGVDEAGRKAQYGDFSGYKDLYGDEIGNLMELTWAMQNPDVAWASGKLSAEDYIALTGRQPVNPTDAGAIGDVAGGLGSGSGSISSRAYSSGGYSYGGGGYSSGGRSGGTSGYGKGYNGPPGYLNTDGQFVVPGSSYGNYANTTAAPGHEADKARADAYANTYASTGSLWAATAAGNDAAANGYSGGSYTGGGSSGGGSSGGGGTTQTWSEKVSDALSNVPIIGNLFK